MSTFSSANQGLRLSLPSITHAICKAPIAICNSKYNGNEKFYE